jgi:hypothetical protein
MLRKPYILLTILLSILIGVQEVSAIHNLTGPQASERSEEVPEKEIESRVLQIINQKIPGPTISVHGKFHSLSSLNKFTRKGGFAYIQNTRKTILFCVFRC